MAEIATILSLFDSSLKILSELAEVLNTRGSRSKPSAREEVESKLRQIRTMELPMMQAFFKSIDASVCRKDEVLILWLNALRNVKTEMLDVVHEYNYLVAADSEQHISFIYPRKQSFRFDTKNNDDWSSLSAKVDAVKSNLNSIDAMKVRYDIEIKCRGECSRTLEDNSWNAKMQELPENLRICLLYCSAFPADYKIKRNRLIRLWVAQGYVRKTGERKSLEEVAEDYLNQLIAQGLLQATERNESGRVCCVKVSDGLRELVEVISRGENFWSFNDSSSDELPVNSIRHVSVLETGQFDRQLLEISSKFWSFHAFSPVSPAFLSNFKVLKVLDLYNAPIAYLPDEIVQLYNLHYLSIRGSQVDRLPPDIAHLQNLQTLDLLNTNVKSIPSGVTELVNLCHLMAKIHHSQTSRGAAIHIGVQVPEGICNLPNLQTLKAVTATSGLIKSLGKLTNLVSLDIRSVKTDQCRELFDSISKMKSLRRLIVMPKYDILQLKDTASPPSQLETLGLYGNLKDGALPQWIGSLPKLTNLILKFSGLQKESVSSLFSFQNLISLHLMKVYDGKELKFHSGSLPKLKFLWMHEMTNLRSIEIENGALVNLNELTLVKCSKLSTIPRGIENLTNLQKLELEDMPEELARKLRNGEQNTENWAKARPIIKIWTRKYGAWTEENFIAPSWSNSRY